MRFASTFRKYRQVDDEREQKAKARRAEIAALEKDLRRKPDSAKAANATEKEAPYDRLFVSKSDAFSSELRRLSDCTP